MNAALNRDIHKCIRLFSEDELSEGETITLSDNPHHYIRNVMRLESGDIIRIFDGKNGEFIAQITAIKKKHTELTIQENIRVQSKPQTNIHLVTPILAKDRLDLVIEKATELGTNHIHLVHTDHAQGKRIKEDRIIAHIIEASEQSERLDIPKLHSACPVEAALAALDPNTLICVAIERDQTAYPLIDTIENALAKKTQDIAFVFGPAGGWSTKELDIFKRIESVKPVSLGDNILRAETAALMMLSCFRACQAKNL